MTGKNQVVVRTYPKGYTSPTGRLEEYLRQGYTVVMCNPFCVENHTPHNIMGNEYILEKQNDG